MPLTAEPAARAWPKSTRFSSGRPKPGKRGRGAQGKVLVMWLSSPTGGQGIGRIRLARVPDASAKSLEAAITASVQPASQVRTDDWGGHHELHRLGYRLKIACASAYVGENLLPLATVSRCRPPNNGRGMMTEGAFSAHLHQLLPL